MKTRKSPRRMSKSRAVEWRKYLKAKRQYLSLTHLCERCLVPLAGKEKELHHWAGRNGRLLYYAPHFRCLCRACHDWVHFNVKRAQRDGWIAGPKEWGVMPKV